jgi:hypothetical protein
MNAKKYLVLTAVCFLGASVGCGNNTEKKDSSQTEDTNTETVEVTEEEARGQADSIPSYARKIIKAYPDFKLKYSNGAIVFEDGTRIVCDDGKTKTFDQKLDDCDIEDMFTMTYDRKADKPGYLADCGRGRCEKLFKKMYGNSAAQVQKNLVRVNWFGQRLPFTTINGADKQLMKVAAEIEKKPELKKYMSNSSTFYWRQVRGAKRQSAHSYGMTIDINTSFSNYWLWANPRATETTKNLKYENRIPKELVEIFEKHGFIWGGRWYHYDTMHFEYRPEFFVED